MYTWRRIRERVAFKVAKRACVHACMHACMHTCMHACMDFIAVDISGPTLAYLGPTFASQRYLLKKRWILNFIEQKTSKHSLGNK